MSGDAAAAAAAFPRLVAEVRELKRRLVDAEVLAAAAADEQKDSTEEVASLVAEIQSLRGREQVAASASSSSENTIEQLKAHEKKLKTLLAKQRAILKEREKELGEERKRAKELEVKEKERAASLAAMASPEKVAQLSAEVKARGEALRAATDELEMVKAKWRADAAVLKDARDEADALRGGAQGARREDDGAHAGERQPSAAGHGPARRRGARCPGDGRRGAQHDRWDSTLVYQRASPA